MSVKILKRQDHKLELEWKHVDSIFLNTIRRIMISNISTISIDKIELHENTSPMNDEFLAHRIGLVPISCEKDVSSIVKQQDCDCKNGCLSCNFEFMLEKENSNDELLGVYSSDLVPIYNPYTSFNVVSYPIFEQGILLCKLAKGQRIKLKATSIKGTGIEHSKWSPVSCVSFSTVPTIKIKNVDSDLIDNIIQSCPKNVFTKKDDALVIANNTNCISCMECVQKSNNKIDVLHNDKFYRMVIESNGSISPYEILKQSLSLWKSQIKDLQNEIQNI